MSNPFSGIRPFFCQVEAVETAIWLTEVAPQLGKSGQRFVDHLSKANTEANPDLRRLALKLATGAGKTTVMTMLIAWQTINAVRRPASKKFTRGFLIVAPGLTIKDCLRVLLEVSSGGRRLLQGRGGEALQTLETEGQMLQRVLPELMGLKNILAINDEAHHCYREKPPSESDEDEALKGDERKEAEENNEAARLWISGLEAVNRKLGLARVFDLSATPFFLRGSGYAEGTSALKCPTVWVRKRANTSRTSSSNSTTALVRTIPCT